jgi:hypothetical protein
MKDEVASPVKIGTSESQKLAQCSAYQGGLNKQDTAGKTFRTPRITGLYMHQQQLAGLRCTSYVSMLTIFRGPVRTLVCALLLCLESTDSLRMHEYTSQVIRVLQEMQR